MPIPFEYREGVLHCEGVDLIDLAERAGTPCYVYSAAGIVERYRAYDRALNGLPHRVCYAVKANGNLSVLRLLAAEGAGFDIVSGGELYRVIQAGGDPASVIFAGVGKTREEIEYALQCGIHSFNCESESEIALIDSLAGRLGKRPAISIRVNPDVDASTHPYISTGLREHKFGIDVRAVEQVYRIAASLPNLRVEGVSCHIGSQILDPRPLLESAEKMVALAGRLRAAGIGIKHLDLGGGVGVPYRPEDREPDLNALLTGIRGLVEGKGFTLYFEPGRSIVAASGVLLTRVLYRKQNGRKEFVIVDGAMNDLLRPSLYKAHHEIWPLRQRKFGTITADVVGPVCESGDFLAQDRELANVFPGDFMAVMTCGAYASVAASNYNARPRAAEVLVEGTSWRVVRERESWPDLVRGEV